MTVTAIDAERVIDSAPVSRLQMQAIGLAIGLGLIDGFDSLIIGFLVPAIASEWNVSAAALTPVLLAGPLATIGSAFLLTPLADRFGRRLVLIAGTFVFGAFTLWSAFSGSVTELTALRFCAGLGLGAVAPCLFPYCSEYAPKRLRATVVTIVGSGVASGGFIGGFVASAMIPAYGWQSVLLVGGGAPLIFLLLTLKWLPESIQFRVARGRDAQAARLLARIAPAGAISESDHFVLPEQVKTGKVPMVALFTEGRALTTILVWIVFINALLLAFFIFSWMPTLLTGAGLGKSAPLVATSVTTVGGMIGGVLLGLLADRVRSPMRLLVGGYGLAVIATYAVSVTVHSFVPLLFATFALGVGVIGTQVCMNAVAASLYPAKIRATGVGWAYGAGKVGSLAGPGIGGLLLGAGVSSETIFLCAIAPAALAAIAMGLLSLLHRTPSPASSAASSDATAELPAEDAVS
jgi:AAHS family 4-hydroxybenzoate transporter-like MFS transporter